MPASRCRAQDPNPLPPPQIKRWCHSHSHWHNRRVGSHQRSSGPQGERGRAPSSPRTRRNSGARRSSPLWRGPCPPPPPRTTSGGPLVGTMRCNLSPPRGFQLKNKTPKGLVVRGEGSRLSSWGVFDPPSHLPFPHSHHFKGRSVRLFGWMGISSPGGGGLIGIPTSPPPCRAQWPAATALTLREHGDHRYALLEFASQEALHQAVGQHHPGAAPTGPSTSEGGGSW